MSSEEEDEVLIQLSRNEGGSWQTLTTIAYDNDDGSGAGSWNDWAEPYPTEQCLKGDGTDGAEAIVRIRSARFYSTVFDDSDNMFTIRLKYY